jgi:hypothetical protein
MAEMSIMIMIVRVGVIVVRVVVRVMGIVRDRKGTVDAVMVIVIVRYKKGHCGWVQRQRW